eukprot:9882556-Lingulodinium_polyedra.AAC.1
MAHLDAVDMLEVVQEDVIGIGQTIWHPCLQRVSWQEPHPMALVGLPLTVQQPIHFLGAIWEGEAKGTWFEVVPEGANLPEPL